MPTTEMQARTAARHPLSNRTPMRQAGPMSDGPMSDDSPAAVIDVERNDSARRYEITLDGELAGYSEFKPIDGKVVFTHTITLPEFGGRGVASTLIKRMLTDVRARGEQVVAVCPFVKKYLETHHEFDDIIAHD